MKKILLLFVVIILIFFRTSTYFVLAQEITPEPTITSTPEVSVENQSETNNEIISESNSGQNEIYTSPTPTIEVVAEDLSTASPSLLPTPTSTPTPISTPTSEITTSDSIATTQVENNINTNIVNSEFVNHVLNIYLPTEGNLDLSILTANVLNKVYGEDNNLDNEVNIKVTSVDNFSYLENNISQIANSGDNQIDSSGAATIQTGDAISSVSVINNVNTNIIDSKIHLVTINIFGSLEGNIILPESTPNLSICQNCSSNVTVSNNALVNNNVNSSANSGSNNLVLNSTGSAEIISGNAESVVNVVNLINANFINTIFKYFYINTLGIWVGDFLGWMDEPPTSDSNITISSSTPIQSDSNCINCSSGSIGGTNIASVTNNIDVLSNTGLNTLESNSSGNISTGNAYSSVSLVNIVNSNFINSSGFIGFINIFGSLVGDVGGSSVFIEEENQEIPEDDNLQPEANNQEINSNSNKESGGLLEVTHTNNVGTHVLPGDTVTFFAKVKNTGSGKVYGTKLKIELFKDGKSYGGSYFNLGDINPQKTLKFSTGLVLSKKAITGRYNAVVSVFGNVGPDDGEVTGSSQSEFQILGFNTVFVDETNLLPIVNASEPAAPQVLGATNSIIDPLARKMIMVFCGSLLLLLILKGYQKRQIFLSYAYRIGSLLTELI